MIRTDRPFDRWFDLADPYDDIEQARKSKKPRPDADREWTYDAPKSPVPIDQRPQQPHLT
jgi:hypothetical protein